MTETKRTCKDCGSTTRPAPHPGPRCHTCNLARRKAVKARNRNARLRKGFGITAEEADEVLELQGGMCICGPWTGYNGKTRPLSVDHDHKTGLIRGRLCKHCNDLLGRVRDDPEYFRAMLRYLDNPPAVQALGARYAPEG